MARFLALDWDQNQLIVAAGDVAGGKARVRRALAWPEEASPPTGNAVELGKRLRERLRAARVSPAPVLACLGRDRVILKEVRHPVVPPAEEAALVRFQVVKELTDAEHDVVIDYVPAGPANGNGNGERRAKVLVVRRDVVKFYKDLCQAAGLTLAVLTPRPFGLAACLRRTLAAAPPEEAEAGAAAGVAIGEHWAEFCVLHEGTLLLTRALTLGPNLAAEVRRNLSVYAGHAGRPPVRALYVAGGTPELRERLSDLTDLPVHAYDPLAGAEAPDLPEGRGAFAGAAGLLHARATAGGLPINFLKPREPKPPPSPVRRRAAFIAALAVPSVLLVAYAVCFGILFACGYGPCWLLLADVNRQLTQARTQTAAYDKTLAEVKKDGKMRKVLADAGDSPALDDLYNLACYVPDVNALRFTKLVVDPLPRTTKARFTDRITITGTLLDTRDPRKPLDQFIAAVKKDAHYSPQPPKVQGNTFTLAIDVERRKPSDENALLPPAPEPEQQQRPPAGGGF